MWDRLTDVEMQRMTSNAAAAARDAEYERATAAQRARQAQAIRERQEDQAELARVQDRLTQAAYERAMAPERAAAYAQWRLHHSGAVDSAAFTDYWRSVRPARAAWQEQRLQAEVAALVARDRRDGMTL